MSSSKAADDPPSRAIRVVRQYLRYGTRSTAQLRAYLRTRGLAQPQIDAVVAECLRRRLLDDRASARLCTEHWARQGYATAAIRLKLAAKGFDDGLLQRVVSQYASERDDEARARQFLAGHLRGQPDRRAPARLARTLASRGFDSELIERVLQSFQSSLSSDIDAER